MNNYINLVSLQSILGSQNEPMIQSFIRLANNTRNIDLRELELHNLCVLCNAIINKLDFSQCDGYYLNYKPSKGISEQFDVLRFSKNSVLNIELKSSIPKNGLDDILGQLQNHRHILSLLNKQRISLFTFVEDTNELFWLDENSKLKTVDSDFLVSSIDSDFIPKNELEEVDLDQLIISPYSDPQGFISHNYHLNSEQMNVRKKILESNSKIHVIKGGPGTGKSLILFDIAKHYLDHNKKVLLIMAAMLPLEINFNNPFCFEVKSSDDLRYLSSQELDVYDIILVDESQRLYDETYQMLTRDSSKNEKLIFAVDKNQVMHLSEHFRAVEDKLCGIAGKCVYPLKEKVRTNVSMATFIQKLLKTNKNKLQPMEFPDVRVVFFKTRDEVNRYISYLTGKERENKYVSIELSEYRTKTTGRLKREHLSKKSLNTNQIIGQEFENVLVVLDEYFFYDENGELSSRYNSTEYYPFDERNSIFQAVTRVRKKLEIVVCNNIELFCKLQTIMTWKEDKEKDKE